MIFFDNDLYGPTISKDEVLSKARYYLERLEMDDNEFVKFLNFKKLIDYNIYNPDINLQVSDYGYKSYNLSLACDEVVVGLCYNPLAKKLYWDIEWTSYGDDCLHGRNMSSDFIECINICIEKIDKILFSFTYRNLQKIKNILLKYKEIYYISHIKNNKKINEL